MSKRSQDQIASEFGGEFTVYKTDKYRSQSLLAQAIEQKDGDKFHSLRE